MDIHKIDIKDYTFKQFIDEQKHLDTDEKRHLIKPIVHIIGEHFKGKENLYCDKSQLNADGTFRRPKKVIEAEQRGFKTVFDMLEADKKAAEEAKLKEVEDKQKQIDNQQTQINELKDYILKQNEVLTKLINQINKKN